MSLAGGGLRQADELRILEQRARATEDAPRRLALLDAELDRIRSAPASDRTWRGSANTYRWWASYLDYAPIDDLAALTVPVYVAHGARDEAVPIESADAIAERFAREGKTNLTYRRYPDLDHSWTDAGGHRRALRVLDDLVGWLRTAVPIAE